MIEDPAHLVLECPYFHELREQYMVAIEEKVGVLWREICEDPSAPDDLLDQERCVRLNLTLGGVFLKRGLASWTPSEPELPADTSDDDTSCSESSESLVDPDDEESLGVAQDIVGEMGPELCFALGTFLSKLMSLRAQKLQPLLLNRDTRNCGAAAATTTQGQGTTSASRSAY